MDLEAELKRREMEDPLGLVYKPHQFQEKIHKSRADITLVIGGNRTGKTYAAVAETLYYIFNRRTHAEVPQHPVTVWYVIPTSSTFTDAIEPVFERLVPQSRIVSQDKRKRYYKFDNGATLVFRTADQRQRRLTGAAVDLVVVDEPCPKVVFDELQARVISTRGRILMVMTPVDENADHWLWVRDELYIPWEIGERDDVDVIHMPVADEDGEPLVPHMTRKDIERFERMYPDPQVRAARMYGEFVIKSGLVFNSFDSQLHLIPRFDIPSNWHRWAICDPQYHRFAVLFFAADDEGNYYVTDEYFSVDETLARRAEIVKAKAGPDLQKDLPMYVDYANPQDITELNYHFTRIGAQIGAIPLPFPKKVEQMILRTHALLEPSDSRKFHHATGFKGVRGAPRLLIFDDLQSQWETGGRPVRASRLTWELKRLTWGKRGKPDKDSAEGADCTDCLIYGCSIPASGRKAPKDDSWKDRLSTRDVRIWETMLEQDRRKRILGR